MNSKALQALICLLVSCEQPNQPPQPPVTPDFPSCETACENQRKLGCEPGKPTAEGAMCEEVCFNSQQFPFPGMGWDVEVLTSAKECGYGGK